MTHEEIEAARLRLQRIAALAVNADEAKAAFNDIDALVEAAKAAQPESLVVLRVDPLIPNFTPVALEQLGVCSDCGAVHALDCRRNTLERGTSMTGACPVCGNPTYRPLNFELIEPTGANRSSA